MRSVRIVLMLMLLLPGRPSWSQTTDPWDSYRVIMWQDRTEAQMRGMPAIGITAVRLRATGGIVDPAERAQRVDLAMPYYLENVATDFYAPYHRFTPGKPVDWLFQEVRARHRADPADPTVFHRQPGLSDPVWIARIKDRLTRLVRQEAPHRPLFYNLADEAGIADLAAAWDFDTAPDSLAGFRAWLATQYADLAALNRQWGTRFDTWDRVVPELTTVALTRTDDNHAAWMDFKTWMDVAFARAVQAGTDAVHGADPVARAALEGAQVPGWGGYDYGRLAPAVDILEIYDSGNALDLAVAANPALIPLRTTFGTGPAERHARWRHLLHGGRGMIVWDENDDVLDPSGAPLPRGAAIGAFVRESAPVAAALRAARSDPDAVAVLVNQASFRIRWLLDRRAGDRDWSARDAEREYDDNAWRAARRTILARLGALGVQPRLLDSGRLQAGALRDGSVRLLLLAHAIALSDREVAEITAFQAAGGVVLADTEPGLYDGHGSRRPALPLPGVPHPLGMRPDGDDASVEGLLQMRRLLQEAGVQPRWTVTGADGAPVPGLETRWFRAADGTRLASLQFTSPGLAPADLHVGLSRPSRLTDLLHPVPGQVAQALDIRLDPIEPLILQLAPP